MSASPAVDYCGLCTQHADACTCCLCAACAAPAALEHSDPRHYDEERDEVLCSSCWREREAARALEAIHAARLDAARERLELRNWRFDVAYLDISGIWKVFTWRAIGRAAQAEFRRHDRSDALAQALQWAECVDASEEVRHAAQ